LTIGSLFTSGRCVKIWAYSKASEYGGKKERGVEPGTVKNWEKRFGRRGGFE